MFARLFFRQNKCLRGNIFSRKNIACLAFSQEPGRIFGGSLEVKLPTIWRDEKQSREEAERRERLEERRVEEKEQEDRRCRCAKR